MLTHAGAEAGWSEGPWRGAQVIATYATGEATPVDAAALAAATHVYWSSVSQFEQGHAQVNANAHHASGPGKTAEHLRRAGLTNFTAFPSAEEWQQWIAKAH